MKNLIKKLNSLPSSIAIIDSGLGGISALNALGNSGITHVLYVADTAYLPYGEKPYEVLLQRGKHITEFLLSRTISTIIVACHTLSSTVLPELQQLYPQVEFIDLLRPIVSYALSVTRNNTIGVLATHNTVQSGRFPTMIHTINSNAQVVQQACPDFVSLLEAPFFDLDAVEIAIDRYLEPMLQANVDTLILGCTHYAFLSDQIQSRLGSACELVSAYSCIRNALANREQQSFTVDFFVSGSLETFRITTERVLHFQFKTRLTYSNLL